MKLSVAFVSVSVLIFVAGCTSNPTSHTQNTTFSPKPEHVVKEKKSITIAKGFSALFPAKNALQVPVEFGLAEGRYIAELKDQYGVYYRGPSQCVHQNSPENPAQNIRMEGGLYIPDGGSVEQRAVIYYYMNSETKPSGNLAASGVDPNGPYLQGQAARTGTTGGAVGTAAGGAVVSGIISSLTGKISFISRVDTKPLMGLVKQE